MKKSFIAIAILIVAAIFVAGVSAADTVGGDKGKIIVKSNAEGATVDLYSINNELAYTGTVENGQAEIYVYSTGTPVKLASVHCDGYEPNVIPINGNPGAGQTVSYIANLKAIPTGNIGGSFGFIQVITNVVGAKVELHAADSKVLYEDVTDEHGDVVFEIATTAKPVSYVYVSADGWKSNNANVAVPQAGKTEVVTVILEPTSAPSVTPTPTPTPTPTTPAKSPLFAAVGVLGVLGAAFLLRKE